MCSGHWKTYKSRASMTSLSHVKPYDSTIGYVCSILGICCKGSIAIRCNPCTAAASNYLSAGIVGKHCLVDDHGASSIVNNATDCSRCTCCRSGVGCCDRSYCRLHGESAVDGGCSANGERGWNRGAWRATHWCGGWAVDGGGTIYSGCVGSGVAQRGIARVGDTGKGSWCLCVDITRANEKREER